MIDDQTKQARSPNASQTSSCTYMHAKKANRMSIEGMINANVVIHNYHNQNKDNSGFLTHEEMLLFLVCKIAHCYKKSNKGNN